MRVLVGGALVQDRDRPGERDRLEVVGVHEATHEEEWRDLLLAWTVAARVKSNAIVFVREVRRWGWVPVRCHVWMRRSSLPRKAGDRAKGAVMAATRSSRSPTRSRPPRTPA